MIQRLTCAGLLLATVVLTACSTDKKADAAQPPKLKEGSVAPRPTVVTRPGSPYQATNVANGVRLAGTVDFDGTIPADTIIHMTANAAGCGPSVTVRRVERTGTRIGGAIVWLSDIRTGKPLPPGRRFELANERCVFSPQIQAVVSPSTLNVVSSDRALHRNRIINVGSGELEGIAPFNDNGEVVPFDSLFTGTEQLEITCDVHPWAKAWILVLDHPYFATTEKSGAFSIENVPPGTYRLKAWHPLLGVAEQTVTVAAGQSPALSLKLGTPAPTPATTDSAVGR